MTTAAESRELLATFGTNTGFKSKPYETPSGEMPWRALLRLVAVTTMVFCSMAVVTPTLHDLVRERFQVGQRGTSLFMLVHSLPQVLLLGLLVGLLSDRWGRRIPLALIGALGVGLMTVLTPWLRDYNALLALRFLDGIFAVVAVGMLMTRALDLGAAALRPRIMGIFMMSIPLGYLTGSALTVLAGLAGGGLGVVYGAAGGAVALTALLLLPDLKTPEKVQPREGGVRSMAASLRRVPHLWIPLLFGFVDKFSFALLATLPALVLRDRYGVAGIVAPGAVMTAFWVAFALASFPAGPLASRAGAWRMIALGSTGYGACLILASAFDSPWMFLLFIGAAGLFTALKFAPSLVLIGQLARPDEKATAISAFNLAGSFGLLLGFAYVGVVSGILGAWATFAIVGAVEILCALFAWRSVRRLEGSAAPQSRLIDSRTLRSQHTETLHERQLEL